MYTFWVSNRKTINRIVEFMKLDQGPKKTVIEAWAGAGTVTNALVRHPSVEKVIALEDSTFYGSWLKRLPEDSPGFDSSKLIHLPLSGFKWETYTSIYHQGALDHLSEDLKIPRSHHDADWQADSPLVFFAHLPNSVHGELLFAQLTAAIATRSWLFQLGRVKLCFVCSESMVRRILSQPGDTTNRSKIGTIAQCMTDIEWHIPGHELLPFKDHVYPPTGIIGLRLTLGSSYGIPNENVATGVGKQALSFVTLEPKKQPLVEREVFEAMDYLMRKLYVLKAKPVHEALKTAAPGANDILKRLSKENPELARDEDETIDPSTPVYCLTNKQWVALARAFEIWPFRPQILIEEGLLPDVERKV
ncbi:S-adenosyl-L-methionine-dependent methyltransferase [Tilletiaria anomala UBC 951]|uniref:rRNA adenine N(6)-methyltransferase n=1 Tax=Tilletiaria anomala (strain ATCC 24038 / CBS 436.72 / UBC 951) TaxID=1037660 RepID=A0A066VU09_TILAU|nr:S-adenosyl-L-methionine-dependent methyltransferase [Tilletiaria anomala UBC 951]KDN42289.1 S-adenosyl-L-methionine-dependent methyltransferase [Tilletiaria anomala UBC 951]